MISGNQKWKGAAPIFIKIAEFIIKSWLGNINELIIILSAMIIITENRKIIDAIDCVIKYFIAASDWNEFLVLDIKGIIDRRLISKPIHIPIQE